MRASSSLWCRLPQPALLRCRLGKPAPKTLLRRAAAGGTFATLLRGEEDVGGGGVGALDQDRLHQRERQVGVGADDDLELLLVAPLHLRQHDAKRMALGGVEV